MKGARSDSVDRTLALTLTRILASVLEQMRSISYCHAAYYTTEAVEQLANHLVESTNGRLIKVLFVSSGSEAVDCALKLGTPA